MFVLVINDTWVGTKAKGHAPSMQLCLTETSHEFNKYLVLHETGHALGLFHEHQHPDADDIFDRKATITGLEESRGMSSSDAKQYYEHNYEKSTERDKDGYDYDLDSVMRYE